MSNQTSNKYESIIFGNKCTKAPKFIETFETLFARHIIDSYILASHNDDSNNESDLDKSTLTLDIVMSKLFTSRRKGMLDPKVVLMQEYKDICAADEAYLKNPDKYPDGITEYGLASEFRCNFIIYNRHRFERCCRKISKDCDENQYCKIHINEDNVYMTDYESQLMDLESDDESK